MLFILICLVGEVMKNKKIRILLLIIWIIVIFVMSSFNAVDSGKQSNFIVNIIVKLFDIENIKLVSRIVRTLAHFTEYLILGILCINLCRKKKDIYIAIIFCILYAISDEVHQLFIHGRAFQVMDIMIDSCGAILGICLLKGKVKE